ncbi:MAG: class I SAM-dependent methyltransferase [Planctomycetota bacterium]|jgi:SAM-dependent methyltransferase
MARPCPLCRGEVSGTVFVESGVEIRRCHRCRHVFSTWESLQDYDGYFGYEDLGSGDPDWWYEGHRAMYDDFCRRFLPGPPGRLLDFGCGLGYFVKHVSERTPWKAYGLEISPTATDFARSKLGLERVHLVGGDDFPFEDGPFDWVTLWDVLEHVPDPHPFLEDLSSHLADGGRLFLHTPNVFFQLAKARVKRTVFGMKPSVHYLEAKDHLNLYSMATLNHLLEMHGFTDVRFVHLHPIRGISRNADSLMRAAKALWFRSSVALFRLTGGKVNLDNLFVTARRSGG